MPCCSYEALGLVATLNPIASGGTERVEAQHADGKEASTEREASATVATQGAGTNGVPKGYGKIIRDGEGNIVKVQLGEEEGAEEPEVQESGVEEEIQDPRGDKELAGWIELGSDPVKGVAGGRDMRVVHGESVWLVESETAGGCDGISGTDASRPSVSASRLGRAAGLAGNRAHLVRCQRWSGCPRGAQGQCRGSHQGGSTRRCSCSCGNTGTTWRQWRGT